MGNRVLRPLDTEPTLWEKFITEASQFFQYVFGFVTEFHIHIIVTIISVSLFYWVYSSIRKRQKNVQKLWTFTLFFLTKRQMLIPLVYRLAEKDQILNKELLAALLILRNKARTMSLRKSPTKRLVLEKEVSIILFQYFTALEAEKKIIPNSKFSLIVEDLEFIDQKLVELQHLYNQEVTKWNKFVGIPLFNLFCWFLRFKKFEAFTLPK